MINCLLEFSLGHKPHNGTITQYTVDHLHSGYDYDYVANIFAFPSRLART